MENITASDLLDDCCCDSDSTISIKASSASNAGVSIGASGSFFFSPINEDCSNDIVIGVDDAREERRRAEGQDKTEQKEDDEEEQTPTDKQQERRHNEESCSSTSRQGRNSHIISSYSTSASNRSNSMNISSLYSPPLKRNAKDSNDVLLGETAHLHCPPPAHSTRRGEAIGTEAAVFSGLYPPSSSFTTRTCNNSSSSLMPPFRSQEAQQASYAMKKRRIAPSTVQGLRSCATYVTRVKASLLTSNHEEKYNAFLDLLCNWSDQGLSSQEVFSQMQLILQDVSPELLAAFTAFLPVDMREEARLNIAATMPTEVQEEEEIEGISPTSDNRPVPD